jgi:hypothetical protein
LIKCGWGPALLKKLKNDEPRRPRRGAPAADQYLKIQYRENSKIPLFPLCLKNGLEGRFIAEKTDQMLISVQSVSPGNNLFFFVP